MPLDQLDLGGGFGVPTYAGDGDFELGVAARGVGEAAADRGRRRRGAARRRLWTVVQPDRFPQPSGPRRSADRGRDGAADSPSR